MQIEYKMFAILGAFFALMAVIYGVWSDWSEPVGTTGLILSTLLVLMIAYYAWFTGRKVGLRPEDDEHGTIDQFQGDYGFFSPYSWWPLFVGLSAALCFLGLAVGWWLFIIGGTFAIFAVIGWTFEYFTGENAQ